MPVINQKKTVSATQLQTFLQWPRQFEQRFIQGLKERTSGRMVVGKAWHTAVERNYREKLVTGRDLTLSQVQDVFSETFDDHLHIEEVTFAPGDSPEKLKGQGLAVTAAYHTMIAPKVQPLLVEEPFRVSLGDDFPYELEGRWDLIDVNGVICDQKSYSKAPTQGDVDRNVQLTTYALAYRLAKGQIEKGLRLDIVIKSKEPYAIQIPTTRTNADCQWLLGVIERMVKVLETAKHENNGGAM